MYKLVSQKLKTALATLCLLTSSNLALAENVEVVLKDKLDGNLSGYCIDIVGGGNNINPDDGLQAHTCYSYRGDLGADQIIDSESIPSGIFHLSEFDVCMTLAVVEAGSKLSLASCNNDSNQQFEFTENGQIRPKDAPQLCLTVGEETRLGRNGTSPHQIKDLTVEACEDDLAAYQQWRTRTEAD